MVGLLLLGTNYAHAQPLPTFVGPATITHEVTGVAAVGRTTCVSGGDCVMSWDPEMVGLFWDTRHCAAAPGANACGDMIHVFESGSAYSPFVYTGVRAGEFYRNPGFVQVVTGFHNLLESKPVESRFEPDETAEFKAMKIFQPEEDIDCAGRMFLDSLSTEPDVTTTIGTPMPTNRYDNFDCSSTQPCVVSLGGAEMSGIIFAVGSTEILTFEVAGVDASGNRGTTNFRWPNAGFSYFRVEDLMPPVRNVVSWTLTGLHLSAPNVNRSGSIVFVTQPYCRNGSRI